MPHVVTCFLRHEESILLGRRADGAPTYPGRWAGVSGYVEGDPALSELDARRELSEETGLDDDSLRLVRVGDPLAVHDEADDWTVHPFLFETDDRDVTPNEEVVEVAWVQPTAILDRETVPGLWDAYRRVGPTVADVADDETHGAAHLSVRALSVLRDAAGDAERSDGMESSTGTAQTDDTSASADDWQTVAAVARDLRTSHPGMAALRTRIDRVLADSDRTPAAVRRRAEAAVTDALGADEDAAAAAAELLAAHVADDTADRPTVLTCSRSGTVAETLRRARPTPAVVVAESRPGGEGVSVAESLAAAHDAPVTLVPDSAVTQVLGAPDAVGAPQVDAVLVGADAILPDASVVNKVGTRGIALAAAAADLPVYAVAARDKVSGRDAFDPERADTSDLDAGDEVAVVAPLFDRTPAATVTAVVTEDGPLDADDVRAVAATHADLADWLGAVDG